jgi:hypothetical protein
LLAAVVALLLTTNASAAPFYTGADQARFAKLLPLVGTLRCSATGGDGPYTATVKVEGAWLVWRENAEDPATEYIRWSPRRSSYVVVEVESGGAYNVSSTSAADPLNATWTHDYPPDKTYGTFRTSFSKGQFVITANFNVNGKPRIGRLSCKKI